MANAPDYGTMSSLDVAILSIATARGNAINRLESDRAPPTNAPTPATSVRARLVGVNGRKTVPAQMARVEYLPDDRKLILPSGLFLDANHASLAVGVEITKTLNTLRTIAGVPGIPDAERYPRFTSVAADANAVHRGTLTSLEATTAALAPAQVGRIDLAMHVGGFSDLGAPVWRGGGDEECGVFLLINCTNVPANGLVFGVPLGEGEASPADSQAAIQMDGMLDQISDYLSAARDLNYSAIDMDFLRRAGHVWLDADCQTVHTADRFVPDLTAYSMANIAALNLAAVGSHTRLAWARAYAFAMGLLPGLGSMHSIEFQHTGELPEDTELTAIVTCHPAGEEGQMYARSCWSLIAAFGALHLANDHTYKQNDESLRRKALVMAQACRTTMTEAEMAQLVGANALELTVRTAFHPFGLSSTYGAFITGQRLRTIAEPLQIRVGIVPPPVQKVGLVVAELFQMFALPIGAKFRTAYGTTHGTLVTLRDQVVGNAAQYSSLYRHYGFANQLVLSVDQHSMCDNLAPIIAGYSEVFNQNAAGQPIGAQLSHVLANARRDKPGLCNMYATAFENYSNNTDDIATLISGGKSGGAGKSTTGP